VITTINGNQVNDGNSLRNIIASAGPGAEVTLNIVREGREQTLRVTLGELRNQTEARPTSQQEGGLSDEDRLGMVVTPITPELSQSLGLRGDARGLVVTDVDSAGAAGASGLRPGDVIEQINRQPVRSEEDLKSALSRAGSSPLLLFVNRRGSRVFVTLRPRG
jgi:S1-C subfamily serine protease